MQNLYPIHVYVIYPAFFSYVIKIAQYAPRSKVLVEELVVQSELS